jgi:SNF2 family DNA or RNA helicase
MNISEKYARFLSYGGIEYKQHQYDGLEWCVTRETSKETPHDVRGGFIADEMGLGKTIMTIGLIVVNFPEYRRTLVVLPSILVEQWAQEILRTTGHVALIYHGSNKKKITMERLERAPVVLTTYGILAGSKCSRTENLLDAVQWDRVIFDEAHHLRNKNSRFLRAKQLRTRSRWLISGTPVQNKLRDFYNMCNILGLPASFYTQIENRDFIQHEYILRRTKQQVGIHIPAVSSVNRSVAWQNVQEKKFALDIHKAVAYPKSKLKMMNYARQTCILPSMMASKVNSLISDSLIYPEHFMTTATSYSSKIDSLIRGLVERRDNGNGKIIFCHYRAEIDEIHRRLMERGFSDILIFDSRMSLAKRMKRLNDSPVQVLIIQINTGCEGLNLQKKFCEIYFVSPNWNPAVQDQAIARCHRIGQTKNVLVFHYVMDSFDDDNTMITMDKYIGLVQDDKRDIIGDVMND